MSSWQTKIKQVVAQCHPPYNAKLKLVYIIKYFHLLTSSQWRSLQWNSPLVHNGMPQGTKNSSRSSIGNGVSCLHDWLLFANTINYSRLSQQIALRNLVTAIKLGFSGVMFIFSTLKRNQLEESFYHWGFLDYCLHLYCYFHNVSANMSSGLLQVFVELGNLHGISNYVLYWNHGGRLFWFC